jgi:predicted AlkP superfamily pyrophosphatase or phosphodiesterase
MQKRCERAFVIGLDGAGGGAVREAQTPQIDRLLSEGAWTYSAQTVYPSSSFPAWGALFHGVGPERHRIDEAHPCQEDVPWPSFFKLARQAWPDSELASFSCWEPINGAIIEPSCACHLVSLPDPELVPAVVAYIRTHDPKLLFVQLDHIDAAGHKHGYGSPAYLAQIAQHDLYVGAILEAIRQAGWYEGSLILLVSDHGGHERSHGTRDPQDMTIVWGCRGPGIRYGCEIEAEVSIMDTAAVVAQALGLAQPCSWEAKIPPGVLSQS